MAARITITTVPSFDQGGQAELGRARRIIDQNFRALTDQLNRSITGGDLVAPGSITEAMLTTAAKTLVGDVTGVIGASGATVVEDVSILTTRGDLLRRGASAAERVALGAANTLLVSDGSDPVWDSISDLIDNAIGSTRGSILYRGASGWAILTPGTAGQLLETQGAGADPRWVDAAGGVAGTDFDVLTDEDGLVLDDGKAIWINF